MKSHYRNTKQLSVGTPAGNKTCTEIRKIPTNADRSPSFLGAFESRETGWGMSGFQVVPWSQTLLALVVGCVVLTSATNASFVVTSSDTLDILSDGASLTAAGTVFSMWTVGLSTASGGAIPIDPAMVVVQAGLKDGQASQPGVQFLLGAGADLGQAVNVDFEYQVASLLPIASASALLDGAAGNLDGVVTLMEEIQGPGVLAALAVNTDSLANLFDQELLTTPNTVVTVVNDLVVTGNATGTASVSSMFQLYELVPEPSTIVMFLSGLLAVFVIRVPHRAHGLMCKNAIQRAACAVIAMAVLAASSPTRASLIVVDSDTLENLTAGASLSARGTVFSDFMIFHSSATAGVSPINPENIVVETCEEADGSVSLHFLGFDAEAGSGQLLDLDFGFQVTSAAPIQAVEAKFDPSKIGVSGGGVVSMSETLFDNFPGRPVGHLSISSRELMQSTMIALPRNTMFVRKDLVVSGGLNGTAFVEDVWQNFVPEPSTFALCGLGAIGLLIRRRPNGWQYPQGPRN